MSTPPADKTLTDWSPCPEGTLGSLGGRLRADHTRRNVLKAAGGVASLAVIALLVVNLMPAAQPDGITCAQCLAQMPAYNDHLTTDSAMTAGDVDAMADHLATCPKCRKHFESEYPGVLATAVTAGLSWISLTVLGARRA